jgi:hypothetical protein
MLSALPAAFHDLYREHRLADGFSKTRAAGSNGVSSDDGDYRWMWSAVGLQLHPSQTFKLSSDPLFVSKVRDIVGL